MDPIARRFDDMERAMKRLRDDADTLNARVAYLEAQHAHALRVIYQVASTLYAAKTEAQRIRAAHGLHAYKHGIPALPVEEDAQPENAGGTNGDD